MFRTCAEGISSTGNVYEPVYPAIGHIAGVARLWRSIGHTVEWSVSVV